MIARSLTAPSMPTLSCVPKTLILGGASSASITFHFDLKQVSRVVSADALDRRLAISLKKRKGVPFSTPFPPLTFTFLTTLLTSL